MPSLDAMRCLIVDDSAGFRSAATAMLARGGIEVVGVASSSAEALTLFAQLQPDLTLVDVDLGADSGFDLAERLGLEGPPRPAVILISTHAEQDLAEMITASPALGFLSKFALSPDAIRAVLSGRSAS